MKAMILAAGRGVRMRPLTDKIPKPLLPVDKKPFIEYQINKLASAGITSIVINVSYRAKQIMQTLGTGEKYGVKIEYSYEPIALETGGGIHQALSLLGKAPFIVISSDIWTNYPLEKLVRHQLESADAHLVLVDNPCFHPYGDFHLNENGLLSLYTPRFTFANFGIYHPNMFKNCRPGAFPLSKVLFARISENKVTGEYFQGDWFNVGTLDELKRLNEYLEQGNNK